mmetsp:Transcript_48714/g.154349  ORF Transcript_48714/g.154349 Transcript_48714/m.154349 type:complete len:266 (-) Transcript_48714:1427-2224(-)
MVEERQGRVAVGRHSIDRRVERVGMEEVKPHHLHVVRQLRVTSLDQLEQAAQRRERHATQRLAVRGKLRPLRDLQDAWRRAAKERVKKLVKLEHLFCAVARSDAANELLEVVGLPRQPVIAVASKRQPRGRARDTRIGGVGRSGERAPEEGTLQTATHQHSHGHEGLAQRRVHVVGDRYVEEQVAAPDRFPKEAARWLAAVHEHRAVREAVIARDEVVQVRVRLEPHVGQHDGARRVASTVAVDGADCGVCLAPAQVLASAAHNH